MTREPDGILSGFCKLTGASSVAGVSADINLQQYFSPLKRYKIVRTGALIERAMGVAIDWASATETYDDGPRDRRFVYNLRWNGVPTENICCTRSVPALRADKLPVTWNGIITVTSAGAEWLWNSTGSGSAYDEFPSVWVEIAWWDAPELPAAACAAQW